MNFCDPCVPFVLLVLVQVLGLLSLWIARLSEGSSRQTAAQGLFFVSLALVGLATLVSLGSQSGAWLSSAAVLSVMVVGAVCDFKTTGEGDFRANSESASAIF